jgi:hypothetical protein
MQSELSQAASRAARQAADEAAREFGREFERESERNPPEPSWDMSGAGAAAGAAAAGALGLGFAEAMDVSTANATLAGQLDLTTAEAERAGEIAGSVYSSAWGGSIEEVNAALGAVTSSVVDMADVTDTELASMTASAIALSDVFEMDVGESTAAVGNLIRNGLVPDAEAGFDAIVAAAQSVPAAMRADIPAVVTEYGNHLARIGLDAETAFGLMSQYVNAGGRDLDQAADVLHEFGRIAFEEGERSAEAFEEIGLDADKMLGAIYKGGPDATEALGMTLDALRDMKDPAEQSAMAVELFGDMAGESTDALWAMDPATAAAASGMDTAAGSAEELKARFDDDPAAVFTSSMRTLQTELSTALAPALAAVSGWAAENGSTMRTAALGVGALVAAVLLVNGAMAVYRAGAIAVTAATTMWTGAQWLLNTAFFTSPITWITLGILALVAGIVLIATKTTWFQTGFSASMTAIGVAWDWIWDKLQMGFRALEFLFFNFTGPGLIIKHFGTIKSAVGSGIGWVKTTVGSGIGWVIGKFGELEALPGKIVGWMTGIGAKIVTPFRDGFRDGMNWIIDKWNGLSFTIGGGSYDPLGKFGPTVSVPSFTFNTPPVPRLASGGIAQATPGGMLALIAEGGEDEVVAPLSALERMLRDIAPTVQARVVTGPAAAPTPQVVIKPDGTKASKMLVEVLQHAIRTDLRGDVTRLGNKKPGTA